jgi:hypothetical protein
MLILFHIGGLSVNLLKNLNFISNMSLNFSLYLFCLCTIKAGLRRATRLTHFLIFLISNFKWTYAVLAGLKLMILLASIS